MTSMENTTIINTTYSIRSKDSNIAATIGIILSVCCLATGGIFVKLSTLDPIATGAWRIGLAMPFMFCWQMADRKRTGGTQSRFSIKQTGVFWLAGVFLGMDLTLWNISFSYTTVANANLLANLVPFIVVPVAHFLYKEKITGTFIVGLLLSISGVVVLLSSKIASHDGGLFGDALAAMTAVFYALYILMVSRCRRESSSATVMYWTGFGSLSVLIPLALVFEHHVIPTAVADLWPLLGLAVVSHVAGQGLLAQCLRYVPASLSSVLVISQPIVAALYAWMLFGEALGPVSILGILVCLAGIYIAKRSKN